MSTINKTVYYFTAKWCGPCQRIKPTYLEYQSTFKNQITFVTIDVDDTDDTTLSLTQEYKINSMPTFVFVYNNQEKFRFSGASADKLKEYLERLSNL
jgi:thioredoxin 1